MAVLQVTSRFAIISTFIVLHAILTSEGRSIKSAWKDEFRSVKNKNQMYEEASQFLTPSQSPRNVYRSDVGKTTVPSPIAHDQVTDSGKSETVYKDDFRPKNHGISPGVSRSFIGLKKEAVLPKAHSSDEEMPTVMGRPDDFEGGKPGHSPGVGHIFQSKNEEPKA